MDTSASSLSHTLQPSPSANPSSYRQLSSEPASPSEPPIDQHDADAGSDLDAEGSEDVEYPAVQSPADSTHSSHNAPSPASDSSTSDHKSKEKQGSEDLDYMQNNPELYGLRRSVSCPF
jgi:hypothetical protein